MHSTNQRNPTMRLHPRRAHCAVSASELTYGNCSLRNTLGRYAWADTESPQEICLRPQNFNFRHTCGFHLPRADSTSRGARILHDDDVGALRSWLRWREADRLVNATALIAVPLAEIELARVCRAMDARMQGRPPLGFRVIGQCVDLFEIRPAWRVLPYGRY